jgi:DNA-binding response OmpR family regulator
MTAFHSKDDEIEALRTRVADLEEEIAAWREYERSETGVSEDWAFIDAIRRRLGVQKRHARLLIGMARSPGRIISKYNLTRMQGSYEDASIQSANVSVVFCRRAFAQAGLPNAIETVWGHGYRLSQDGADLINAIIAPHRRKVA